MRYFKCADCWRMYDEWQLINSPMDACMCGSKRFRLAPNLKVRRFLTNPLYIIFGERVYDKKRS